jgi:hypothetical protein
MPTLMFLEIIISYVVITKGALCLNKALLWLPVHIVSLGQIGLNNSIHTNSSKYLMLICSNYFKVRPNNSKLQTNNTTSNTTNAI